MYRIHGKYDTYKGSTHEHIEVTDVNPCLENMIFIKDRNFFRFFVFHNFKREL